MSENSNSQENGGGTTGTAFLVFLYLVALSVLVVNGIIQFWPETPIADSSKIDYFGISFAVSGEIQLLLLVLFMGALGGMVHALRSYFFHIGTQDFSNNYIVWYVLLPFVGSFTAVIFYLVVRAGFFSPSASIAEASPFGFAALAGLVGMFSNEAALKLKDLADQIFSSAEKIS